MSLTLNDVIKTAHLARLKLDPDAIPAVTEKLTNVLNMIAEMQSIDTSKVEPMSHPLDLHQALRDDVVTVPDQRELMQSLAPKVEAGLYLVPQVIE